jgi:uncharacterized protein (TIGR00730 family)
MQDFTAGGISGTPNRTQSSGDDSLDDRIRDLVAASGCTKSCDLVEEMIITALKMGRDQTSVADLKLFNRSLKEMRYAARVFAPFRDKRKISVFGSARTASDEPEAVAAEAFSRAMVEHGYMIITGGGDGIMGAAQRGAGREKSFGLNIRLPFEQSANKTIHGDEKLVNFNYFFTRKLNFVKESHGVALFPGGFGTLDEGFEVLTLMQTGKARIIPVVLVDKPGGRYWETWFSFLGEYLLKLGLVSRDDFRLFHITHSVEDAVRHFTGFYKNYRSYRWVGAKMVIRITQRISAAALKKLNDEFDEVLKAGDIVQTTALPEEANEPELAQFPRLVLTPHQRNFGILRALIDAINASEVEG